MLISCEHTIAPQYRLIRVGLAGLVGLSQPCTGKNILEKYNVGERGRGALRESLVEKTRQTRETHQGTEPG